MSELSRNRAVALTRYLPASDEEAFFDTVLSKPVPEGRDIVVAIKAISVNPVDTKVRAPKNKVEPSPVVLGWDASGIVERVGPDVTLFKPGDAVYYAGDLSRPGTYQQFQLVDERIVGRKPTTLNDAEAAALPLTAITAWEALFDRLGIATDGSSAGKSILMIGAAGGVGSIAIQLAKWAGLNVIGTASRLETIEWVAKLGADSVVNHREDLVSQVRSLGHHYVDYIAIFNDMRHWEEAVELIRPQGKIVSIDDTNLPMPMAGMKTKAASLHWEFMFARSKFKTPDMIEQHHLLTQIAQLVDEGKVRTTATETLHPINAKNLRAAHVRVEGGRMVGKLVLEGW